MKTLAALLALALAAAPAAAQTLPPRDECAADADFTRFRAELLDIAARHDGRRLLAIVAEDISFSFGGEAGRADFAREWGLATPETSGLWPVLANALVLGCTRDGEERAAPYFFQRMPEGLDPFTSGVARAGARLYRERSNEGEGAVISWAVLAEVTIESDGWGRVRLADGRTGYIEAGSVISPIDYRAIFGRRAGQWRMVAFIAGD